MNHSRYYDEDGNDDREFWLIILTTWTMWEIEAQEQFAENHEAMVGW